MSQPQEPLLNIVDVRKSFGDNLVLDNLTLTVDAHSCVVLIGASGSGKSTLLRCIDLLETVDDGYIELAGADITDPRKDQNAIRSQIGMVFQAFNLFPHMKVIDNITLAPRLVHGVDAKTAQERGMEMLSRVGLAEKAQALPDQLSGGQQQRAAIARSLVNSPKLMLLDEVTSALDPELVGEVLDLLGELKDEGMTMVIATHEMAFAKEVADEVCFLHAGQVLEHGTGRQVLESPTEPRTQEFLRRLHLS